MPPRRRKISFGKPGSWCVMLFLFVLAAPAAAATAIQGVASVIDGDTIEIHGTHIRLTGIDAPESSQTCEHAGRPYRCGQVAALALSDKLGSRMVTCQPSGIDRYRRTLADCWVGGIDVNRWLVRQGYAVAYRRYSMAYVGDENAAREAKLGIWAGTFEMPADYRREHRAHGQTHHHGKRCGRSYIAADKTCHQP